MQPLQVLKDLAKKKLITTKEYTRKALTLLAREKEIKMPYLTQQLIDRGRIGTQSEVNARMKAIGV